MRKLSGFDAWPTCPHARPQKAPRRKAICGRNSLAALAARCNPPGIAKVSSLCATHRGPASLKIRHALTDLLTESQLNLCRKHNRKSRHRRRISIQHMNLAYVGGIIRRDFCTPHLIVAKELNLCRRNIRNDFPSPPQVSRFPAPDGPTTIPAEQKVGESGPNW